MLVYGTAMVVMERSTGNMAIARSKTAYLLFGLGFTNLLFGWAHHIWSRAVRLVHPHARLCDQHDRVERPWRVRSTNGAPPWKMASAQFHPVRTLPLRR
jgi:hypothetical protein